VRFLSVEEVLALHDDQLSEDCGGGSAGLRSLDLLQSAVAQPEATFGGELLHPTVWDQAAAYAYHLARNHPFVDANKRTALNAALTFLALNGQTLREDANDELVEMMVRVAEGGVDKAALASQFRALVDTADG
jgi:death-on-curing protein